MPVKNLPAIRQALRSGRRGVALLVTAAFASGLGAAAVAATTKKVIPSAGTGAGSTGAGAGSEAGAGARNDAQFRQGLSQMLERVDKSIKTLSAQITESLSAPFLPELYLELAELQSQKSTTLYYIQMEVTQGESAPSDPAFAPVTAAQKEAITTYKMILHDFPRFAKRPTVLFNLALAAKSIDETRDFMLHAGMVLKQYPQSEEAFKCKLLIGQFYLDQKDFSGALNYFLPLTQSSFVYERNVARHKAGLSLIAVERFKEALHFFELVATDRELKPQDNPYEVSLTQKTVKNDLKRQALLDSVVAYTYVFPKNPDPVAYYARVAGSAALFQEVLEKLVLRYIAQKHYATALPLLRKLGELAFNPQKSLTIYRDVLTAIEPADRVRIPVAEMRSLLSKYAEWVQFYQIPPQVQAAANHFLENEVRELGTKAHELARLSHQPSALLERARDFYLLYLDYFFEPVQRMNIANDLAQVYFQQKDYLACGQRYLQLFSGQYGTASGRESLLQNAILCLSQKAEMPYYENLRLHGLLIKSIGEYFVFNPQKRSDPQLNLALLKANYEQGFFPETLEQLYRFIGQFSRQPQAADAAELILDYYNTRQDFPALQAAAKRLERTHWSSSSFRAKLAKIEKMASSKGLQESIRKSAGFDDFSQGKSYLEAALKSDNVTLRNQILKEALVKSKRERDIQTFLSSASAIAQKERDPEQKSEILRSVVQEHLQMTQFSVGLERLAGIYQDPGLPERQKAEAFQQAVGVALALRSAVAFNRLMSQTERWSALSPDLKHRVSQFLADSLAAPFPLDSAAKGLLARAELDPELLLAAALAENSLPASLRARVASVTRTTCSQNPGAAVCQWSRFVRLERSERLNFLNQVRQAAAEPSAIEAQAKIFAQLTNQLKALEGVASPQVALAVSLRSAEAFAEFGQFLKRVSQKHPELQAVLSQKVKETQNDETAYRAKCQQLASSSAILAGTLAARSCQAGTQQALGAALFARSQSAGQLGGGGESSDHDLPQAPGGGEALKLQKELFGETKPQGSTLLKMIHFYYDQRDYHFAAAAADIGQGSFPAQKDEFQALLGCSVMHLGFLEEAAFHLKSASGASDPQKRACESQLKGLMQ